MALVYVTDDEPNICKLVAFGLKDEEKTGRYHFRLDDAAPGWLDHMPFFAQ